MVTHPSVHVGWEIIYMLNRMEIHSPCYAYKQEHTHLGNVLTDRLGKK